MSVLGAMIIGYLIEERVSNLKHMQTMTGLRLDAYWVGNFFMDLVKFVPNMLLWLCFVPWYCSGNFNKSIATVVALPFGFIPFLYVTSFLFSSEASG